MQVTLPQVFFKHFAGKKQLPGFYISRTLVENELKIAFFETRLESSGMLSFKFFDAILLSFQFCF